MLAGLNPLLRATTLLWFYVPGLLSRCGARTINAFPLLDDFIDDASIQKRLARARIQLAQKRHDQHFLYTLNHSHRDPAGKLSQGSELVCSMMPPRRNWSRPNRIARSKSSSKRIAEISILNAIKIARRMSIAPDWLVRLDEFSKSSRRRLVDIKKIVIGAPRITLIPKDSAKKTFRPLATFSVEDQAIVGAAADCLRATIDDLLSNACYAFRTCVPGQKVLQHHDAVDDLRSYIIRNNKRPIYIAECDIQKFFDTVSHKVAKDSLALLFESLRSQGRYYDRRLSKLFDAYLASYNYPTSVEAKTSEILAGIGVTSGTVPWVRQEIDSLYPDGPPVEIGVPQGGALSPVIANIVLHAADNAIREKADELGVTDYFYARYCDDMVIAATDEEVTKALFKTYLMTLKKLRLPYHSPTTVTKYSSSYFEHKSKDVYPFGSSFVGGLVPWIAFLGYHIRYDGKLRIRKSSIAKEIEKQVTVFKDVLRSVDLRGKKMRVSGNQALHRARMRLIAMSVGRASIQNHGPKAEHEMCWVNGFELLKRYPHSSAQLRTLDRVRARLLAKLKSRLSQIRSSDATSVTRDVLNFYGRPFSYFAQFDQKRINKSAPELTSNSSQAP